MAYDQQTVTNVNPAVIVQGALDTMLIAEDWEVVDTFTPSGDYRVKVYKSNAADNACGYDWFVAIMWDVTGSESYFNVLAGSGYDSGTKLLTKIAVTGQSATNGAGTASPRPTRASDGASFGDYNLNTSVPMTNANVSIANGGSGVSMNEPINGRIVLPSAAFGFWASVTLDHVAIFYAGAISGGVAYYTLDVDEDYQSYFNGALGPVVAYGGATFSGNNQGTLNQSYNRPTGLNIGAYFIPSKGEIARSSVLPTLTGPNDLIATAFRPRIHLVLYPTTGANTYVLETPPIQKTGVRYGGSFPNTERFPFEPVYVGQAIDLWQVRGGSRGDTITIGDDEWVLMNESGLAFMVED